MAVPTEFYPEIFLFEIQKKHGKHLRIQKIFRICVSNTIYDLIMAELKIFLQYKASTVYYIIKTFNFTSYRRKQYGQLKNGEDRVVSSGLDSIILGNKY